jgi:hypothetical protein
MRLISLSVVFTSALLVGCKGGGTGGDTDQTSAEDCSNGADDDGDGAVDCADDDCSNVAVCDTDTVPPVQDDTIDEAVHIDLSDTQLNAFDDDLNVPGDRDFRSFEATEGQDYFIYVQGGGDAGEPDTVVRVYDPSKTMIGENDDTPYRLYGTDSGYYFRALETGTYYVEVLEWSDWYGDSPGGGAGWDYTLYLEPYPTPENNENGADFDNDTIADEAANLDTLANEDTTLRRYSFYRDPWTAFNADDAQFYYWAVGAIDEAGDVDTFGYRWDVATDGTFYPGLLEFSMLPDIATNLDATFDLYDSEGNLVATTDSPELVYQGLGLSLDTGLGFLVTEPGDYFLQITDASGGSGNDHWYAIMGNPAGYIPEYLTIHDLATAQEADPIADAQDLVMSVSSTDATVVYGIPFGRMENDGDQWDSFKITDDGVGAGRVIHVDIATMGVGSLLDASISLLAADGTVLETATTHDEFDSPDDPQITSFDLPSGTGDTVYVVIENENDEHGLGAFYEGFISIGDE